jgi:tetratricopeptide (TPR) repeat protein
MLEAARCALQLGQLDRCQSALQQAEQLGADVRLDRAELLLAYPTPDPHAVQALLQARAAAHLAGADRMRAFRLAQALRTRGEVEAGTLWIEARCLESFGDWAGALAVYGELLGRDPARDDARERARACGLELALRLDATSGAGAPGADPGPDCTSAFTGARVSASALPRADHLRADPWLELAALYLKTDRPLEAYRKARAARTVEPERPETYLAVGQAASRIGGRDIAKLAFVRALELDGRLEAARMALRQLSTR